MSKSASTHDVSTERSSVCCQVCFEINTAQGLADSTVSSLISKARVHVVEWATAIPPLASQNAGASCSIASDALMSPCARELVEERKALGTV